MNNIKYNFSSYEELDRKIICICNYDYKFFLNKANVMGLGLSYKIKNNFNTFRKCIKVFVTQKTPHRNLCFHDLIPKYYKGIETDVVQSDIDTICSLKTKVRPVTCGYSIGPESYAGNGSLGCIVADNHSNHYILSNNHVIALQGLLPLGTGILQPSNIYGGTKIDIIAKLSNFIPLKYKTPSYEPENTVDCAIAKILNKTSVSNKVTFLGKIKGVGVPVLGQNVKKVGATTSLTTGKITAIAVTRRTSFIKSVCLFKNQILTTAMSTNGDSGSILLDDNMNALGLLMADNPSNSTYNPIQDVLSSLDVSIVTN